MPVSNSVVRSTSPVISTLPSSSTEGCRRSITSNPSASTARRSRTGSSHSGKPGKATRRAVHTSGCSVIGSRPRRSRASPARPPAWSKWPWLSTTASMLPASRPSRSKLSAMPYGDTPVSNSSVCVRSPRRVVTSAENPCSATSPRTVSPCTNCGAGTRRRLAHRRPVGWARVDHQAVVAVVDQHGDDQLVDGFEGDRIDGVALHRGAVLTQPRRGAHRAPSPNPQMPASSQTPHTCSAWRRDPDVIQGARSQEPRG